MKFMILAAGEGTRLRPLNNLRAWRVRVTAGVAVMGTAGMASEMAAGKMSENDSVNDERVMRP